MIAGADGCKTGWLLLYEDGAGVTAAIAPTAAHILDQHPTLEVLAIDIPIGIPAAGPRVCDQQARKLLKGRSSCVFPAPVRPTFEATSYASACDLHELADGRKLSKQAHAILPKIKEVDTLIRAHPRGSVVYEIHPEVSFAAMNDMQPLPHSKHTLLGLNQRLDLVKMEFGPEAFASVRTKHKRSQASDDDILDAFAALWSARRIHSNTSNRLPPELTRDDFGVPMHINY
jgi:predicted RNase H-like nuclease